MKLEKAQDSMGKETGFKTVEDLYRSIFSRNIGFFTESEQDKLRKATVAIGGVGGIGGLLAERLIRLGVGHLRITDPEDFDISNLNRQFCSSLSNLGRNKAEVVYSQIKDINSQARIDWNGNGIKTQKDVEFLLNGCEVVVDAMDFGLFRESVMLQREARRRGIYYLFACAVGFGALVVVFDPRGQTLEEYNGVPADADLNDAESLKPPLERICPVIPSYAVPMSPEGQRIIREIIIGERAASSNSIGVGLASVVTANEVVNIIIRKRDIPTAPHYTYVDLIDRRFLLGTMI